MHALAADAAPVGAATVVLVHGLVVSSRSMIPTMPHLAAHYRVFAPDLPGFGRSADPGTALDIAGLADGLADWMGSNGLSGAAVVGNSLGCQVVVDLALRHPTLVERAVLLGPTFDAAARSLPRQFWRLLLDMPLEPPSPRQTLWYLQDLRDGGVGRAWATLWYGLTDPIEQKVDDVAAPTLVMRGEHDPISPRAWTAELARRLPHGYLVEVAGGAHTINRSAPEDFVRALRPFLDAPLATLRGGWQGDPAPRSPDRASAGD